MKASRIYKSGLPKCYFENIKKAIDSQYDYLFCYQWEDRDDWYEELLQKTKDYINKKLETKQYGKKKTKTRHG